jgi:hypothetical protein
MALEQQEAQIKQAQEDLALESAKLAQLKEAQ